MNNTSENTKKKAPSHVAYSIREGKDGKGYFNRIGIAFAHKDAKGFDVLVEALPLDGRITLREASERPAE